MALALLVAVVGGYLIHLLNQDVKENRARIKVMENYISQHHKEHLEKDK